MPNWYCDSDCRINAGGAGPWYEENKEFFSKVKSAHSKCPGFQIGEPKLGGKANWGITEIEKKSTQVFNQIINSWFHELIASLKGPEKICLIKDKWKWMSQT